MADGRSHIIPQLEHLAFEALKKTQTNYLKNNGFFSSDVFSISSNDPHQVQAAAKRVEQVVLAVFLQAVIDDDRKTVEKCLEAYPELLLATPDENFVLESKLTWQKFYAENGAIMAAKRKQIEMLKIMLPFYDKLEQTDAVKKAKADAISAWSSYEMSKNAQDEDEIVIPQEYVNYAQSLINVFNEEPCSLDATGQFDPTKLSEKTESELSSLLNILVPKQAVKLDNYFDVELFLLAVYKAYRDENVLNWNQRDAFCIRVIGLIQSALTPETAKILCHSLDEVVTAIEQGKNIEIGKEALLHILRSGELFYRKSRNDLSSGIGSKFLCGIYGRRLQGLTCPSPGPWVPLAAGAGRMGRVSTGALEYFMSNKNIKLGELLTQQRPKPKSCRCVIV